MAFDIVNILDLPVVITGAVDVEGTSVEIPEGTSFSWSVVTVSGNDPGTFVVDAEDNMRGMFNAGVAGSQGYIAVTATLPDGTIVNGQSEQFNIVPSALAGFIIQFGDPVTPEV